MSFNLIISLVLIRTQTYLSVNGNLAWDPGTCTSFNSDMKHYFLPRSINLYYKDHLSFFTSYWFGNSYIIYLRNLLIVLAFLDLIYEVLSKMHHSLSHLLCLVGFATYPWVFTILDSGLFWSLQVIICGIN